MEITIKILRLILFSMLIDSVCVAQDQAAKERKDSLSGLGYESVVASPKIYILDGLKLSANKLDSLGLKFEERKKTRGLDPDLAQRIYGDAGKNGVILITTRKFFIVNAVVLRTSKEKEKVLSLINENDIQEFKKIQSNELLKRFGITHKHGAILVNTKGGRY